MASTVTLRAKLKPGTVNASVYYPPIHRTNFNLSWTWKFQPLSNFLTLFDALIAEPSLKLPVACVVVHALYCIHESGRVLELGRQESMQPRGNVMHCTCSMADP